MYVALSLSVTAYIEPNRLAVVASGIEAHAEQAGVEEAAKDNGLEEQGKEYRLSYGRRL